jgi:pyruvate/2-oxoglutarate dehydrogenase complex dihydrolipoamide acyltransferase (E2) component
MRQPLGEFDDRDDDLGLVGEERADEFSRPDRRLPAIALAVLAMALFAGGLWFAYVEGTRHPATTARSEGVPLIRADQHPAKVRPDQPGGMTIPDQNISLYNEKAGGPPVEKLLPAPEQPLPRPAPAAKAAAAPAPPAVPPAPVASAPPPAEAAAAAKPAARPARAKAATVAASSARAGKGTPVRIQLGAVHSPDAARAQWARLKREQPDLLGKLTAVAVRADLGDKGIFYRIEAGPLNEAAADRLCGELKRRNLGCALAR